MPGRIDVVVIDDARDVLEMLGAYLRPRGLEVRGFDDPIAALESIRAEVPSIVVTDLQMTPVDGVEVARALRAEATTARVPIVALTGCVDPEWDTVRWFDAYLRKPIDLALARNVLVQLALAVGERG